jgi:hypothetical protein
MVSPVTAEVGSFTLDADPVPETVVHVPVSEPAGLLAAKDAVVVLHKFWSGPASATVVAESTLIVTSLVEGGHPPDPGVMVHLNTVVPPMVSPVTDEVGLLTEVADPVPDIADQVPVSEPDGVLAAKIVTVVLHRS